MFAALATGCYASAGGGYGYTTTASVSTPNLVYIDSGVQVVENYDYPVFYSDNLYWRYDNNVWYSSRYHDRGWATSYNVPVRVRGIDRPYRYTRYRGNANVNARYRNDNRNYTRPGPVVRDHRTQPVNREPVVRDQRRDDRRGPVVRDHRR
ncbi:MAG: hypothetical protein H0T79_11425 [Deltaproteobacteria bacterium]|nr:hypothetical protein [Deltaproteobacteria bacterium]